MVTLQFSNERRDRRKREYVMIEENEEAIIDILAPISDENRKAFSLASKVEVQYVIFYTMYVRLVFWHKTYDRKPVLHTLCKR